MVRSTPTEDSRRRRRRHSNAPNNVADGSLRYVGSYVPTAAGMYGCTVRVLPNHPDLTTPMELGRIAWA